MLLLRLAIAFALALPAFAQPRQPADITPLLRRTIEKHKLPAMAAVVIEGDRIVASGAAGVRRPGDPTPITINDRFHLGSCSKAMTATLCGMLVDEGKLSWNTTLAQSFPDAKDQMDPAWRQVTLEMLLTHHAGLPDDRRALTIFGRLREMNDHPLDARHILMLDRLSAKPVYPPGSKFIYSNCGYAIAGHIAETTTGIQYEDLMQKRLFDPLGMKSAGFGPPGEPDTLTEPRGQNARGVVIEPGRATSDNPSAWSPGGRVHASLPDWARFVSLHLSKGNGLIKPLTLEKLHTPADAESHAAMGWFTAARPWGSGTVLYHNGTNTYWFAIAWIAPKRNFAVLIATNNGDGEKATDEVAGVLVSQFPKFTP